MLDILDVARRFGALTMVHAENNAMIKWMTGRLKETGNEAAKFHGVSHPRQSEVEAINRAIQLATFLDAPLLIVHVSTNEGANAIAQARQEGRKILGETCPQYMFLTDENVLLAPARRRKIHLLTAASRFPDPEGPLATSSKRQSSAILIRPCPLSL